MRSAQITKREAPKTMREKRLYEKSMSWIQLCMKSTEMLPSAGNRGRTSDEARREARQQGA